MSSISSNESSEPVVDSLENIEKKRVYPTFIDLAAIFGVLVISQVAVALLTRLLLPYIAPTLSDNIELEQAWMMLVTQVISMTFTIAFIYFIRNSRKAPKISVRFSFHGFDPTILLGGLLMMISTSVVIEPLLSLMPLPAPIVARGWPLLVAVIFGAPLFEEFICRGLIFESLRSKSGVVLAWLCSSLFFALIHIDPVMVINAFFMGLILCYIYIRSQSLVAPMILHAINNSIAYIFIVMGLGDNVMLKNIITNQTLYYILYGVAVFILIASTVICARQFKKIVSANKRGELEPIDNIIDSEE